MKKVRKTDGVAMKNKRRWPLVLAGITILLLVLGVVVGPKVVRLQRALSLFERQTIVASFRSMGENFSSSELLHGATTSALKRDPRELPASYNWKGVKKDTRAFIDHTWTTGLVVLRDDTILFEDYWKGNTAASRTISWSVAKSFVSALFGIAVSEGSIRSLDDRVESYLPSLAKSGYAGVKLKDVLQMSSGIRFDETYADPLSDINKMSYYFGFGLPLEGFIAGLKRDRQPGTFNHYVSMDTQVLGMVLKKATGMSLSAYAESRLWQPLGMESDARWLVDGAGMEMAFGGLNAVLRDYARLGLLYLDGGKLGGKQIVPADWVKASVTPDAPHLMPGKRPGSDWVLGYGYQWWIPENPDGDFLAIGIYGQAIYVYPRLHIVIARSAAYPDYDSDGEDMELESIEFFRAIARSLGGE